MSVWEGLCRVGWGGKDGDKNLVHMFIKIC